MDKNNHDGRPLTTDEVADRYRTSASTVRYWRAIGYGPKGRKVGRRVLYDPQDVEAFWQSRVEQPGGEDA